MKKEYDDTNPLHVFQDVYDVIMDRKKHPKEGSYTNYLFDKWIDKILKKVGEECTEIVIAAKNPDKEEIKYEISDFLYHAMVLMVEKGVTWEDITRELARRWFTYEKKSKKSFQYYSGCSVSGSRIVSGLVCTSKWFRDLEKCSGQWDFHPGKD